MGPASSRRWGARLPGEARYRAEICAGGNLRRAPPSVQVAGGTASLIFVAQQPLCAEDYRYRHGSGVIAVSCTDLELRLPAQRFSAGSPGAKDSRPNSPGICPLAPLAPRVRRANRPLGANTKNGQPNCRARRIRSPCISAHYEVQRYAAHSCSGEWRCRWDAPIPPTETCRSLASRDRVLR